MVYVEQQISHIEVGSLKQIKTFYHNTWLLYSDESLSRFLALSGN